MSEDRKQDDMSVSQIIHALSDATAIVSSGSAVGASGELCLDREAAKKAYDLICKARLALGNQIKGSGN